MTAMTPFDDAQPLGESLERLSEDLLGAIDRFRADQDAHLLGMRLTRLMSLLRLHFAREDRLLVAQGLAKSDAALARNIRMQAEGLDRVTSAIESYADRYADPGAIVEDLAGFHHDSRSLLAHLAERIEQDREHMPPMAAAMRAEMRLD